MTCQNKYTLSLKDVYRRKGYECVKDQTLINSQWTLASSLRIN